MVPIAIVGIVAVWFLFLVIWATRYVKGGPNKVLIVSGRKIQLPDGNTAGYRFVKGGGTFVFPILEQLETLSLEVVTLEFNRLKVRAAKGAAMSVDGVVQFKINGDYRSIAAAAEQLLSKSEQEIKSIVQIVLEKHLGPAAGSSTAQELDQSLGSFAGRVQEAATPDLNAMGIGIVSLTLREVRSA